MRKIFNRIGSIIYSIILPFWTIKMCIWAIIVFFINKKAIYKLANFWGYSLLTFLEICTGLKVKYINKPSHTKGQIFVSEHQSTLEILALIAVIDKPIFVLKKSLINLPIFGRCMKFLGMIPVDRKNLNANWINEAKKQLAMGKNLIIFPEGTRVEFGQEIPYRQGAFKLAKELNQDIIPVAINTGLFWPRRTWIKKQGTAKIVFGKPITPDNQLLRKTFYELLKR